MKIPFYVLGFPIFGCLTLSTAVWAGEPQQATSVSQYGITWTFDRPRPVGQFITGDWWVQGPVVVTQVSPASQPATESIGTAVKSQYGAVSMQGDRRLRNGSMIVLKPDREQGYDSRLKNYKPEKSVMFPVTIETGRSLISTISNEALPVPVMQQAIMWKSEREGPLALNTAAVLTVVDRLPPADAFRPAYAGTDQTIYRKKDLHWEILPALTPVANTPSWAQFERYLQRPWLDHIPTWLFQHTGPSENQVNYGREFARITSIASLMLMLDEPREKKEKLMIDLVQLGIDLDGLARTGRQWNADGGHWNGRKWPLLFAALMLGDRAMAGRLDTVVFSEDAQMYYGRGALGQTALYQMVFHTGPQQPYEEKNPATWDAANKRSENYRIVVSGGLPGTALAVQLMKAKAAWNNDAFFDYYDRWMSPTDPYAAERNVFPRPKQEGKSLDAFVDAMWAAYRSKIPSQPGARDNRKWVWSEDGKGHFEANDISPAAK